jgi:hypothetical protein
VYSVSNGGRENDHPAADIGQIFPQQHRAHRTIVGDSQNMNVDRILPRILVGSCPISTEHIDELKRSYGVTAVLNLQTEEDFAYWGINWDAMAAYYRDSQVEIRRVPVRDFDPDALRANLHPCVAALDQLLRAGHTVYVHCSAGVNRSPSTVIAYLHWVEQCEWHGAVNQVTSRRKCDPYLDAIRLATEDRAN